MLTIVVLGITALTGCNSGGGGGGNPVVPTDCVDVAGRWSVEEEISIDCSGETDFDAYEIQVTQNGCTIVVDGDGDTFSGTISGNTMNWMGSFTEDDGTVVTINSLSVTIAEDGMSFSGTASWTSNDGEVCTGTTQIQGLRL